jgi:hypothetical protein
MFSVCHVKVECVLGLHRRRLFGRLARAMTINMIFQNFKVNFYPTRKRTEVRAPVWGSVFTSKDATLKGGVQQKLLLS